MKFISLRENIKKIIFASLIVFIPNVLFLLISIKTDTARPLINSDYNIVALLLCLSLMSWKATKFLSFLILTLTILSESLLFTMQVFPIKGLADLLYLTPFLVNAPISYIVMPVIIIMYIIIIPIILISFSKKTTPNHLLPICILTIITGFIFGSDKYKYSDFDGAESFGRKNYYIIKSQLDLYYENSKHPFLLAANEKPIFSKLESPGAMQQISESSNKIILIMAESYGSPALPEIQKEILSKLTKSNNFSYFEEGNVLFSGLTVQAEIRELCNKKVEGFSLRKTTTKDYTNCLMNEKNKKGLKTIALHGSSSLLYDRNDWYKKAGFAKTIFSENLPKLKRCTTFNGICDSELLPIIKSSFKSNDKLFFYWLTLTGHYPYPDEDIHNQRFDCNKYKIKSKLVCNNLKIQTQFMDQVSDLASSKEMKGVEFIVVGDHLPPIFDKKEKEKFFNDNTVPWLHFKTKIN